MNNSDESEKSAYAEETKEIKQKKCKNIYRRRFYESGGDLSAFDQFDVLNLLQAFAQQNPKPAADELMQKFHRFSNVFDADALELKQITGVNESFIVLLKAIPQVFRQYQIDKSYNQTYSGVPENCRDFLKAYYSDATVEKMLLLCLDDKLNMIDYELISSGTTQKTDLDIPKILRSAIFHKCHHVILSHNHPNMPGQYSNMDLFSTKQAYKVLKQAGVNLVDHIVIGKYGDVVSIREHEKFE